MHLCGTKCKIKKVIYVLEMEGIMWIKKYPHMDGK